MIRFNCPHCGRYYELPPALAGLPLVCKQCGERITPPAAEPDPPAPPKPKPTPPVAKPVPVPPPPRPVPPVAKIVEPPKPVAKPPAPPPSPAPHHDDTEDDDDGVFVTKPDSSPDIDFNVGGPTAASLSDADKEAYTQQIESFVVPIEERSLDAYENGWKKAIELGIYNQWTAKMRESLGRLNAELYPAFRETGFEVRASGPSALPALIDAPRRAPSGAAAPAPAAPAAPAKDAKGGKR